MNQQVSQQQNQQQNGQQNGQQSGPQIEPVGEFKRLNFFNGFFTTADDWNDGEDYHLAKRKLHNRALHTPGILRNEGNELQVVAEVAEGGMKVRVKSGAALDGHGNLICLPEERVLDLGGVPPAAQTFYIYIQFDEGKADRYVNVEDPEFSGHRRMLERPVVGFATSELDNYLCLELARVYQSAGATQIADPSDPNHPQANEIDGTYRSYAGAVEAAPPRLDPEHQRRLNTLMLDLRENMAALARRFRTQSLGDVRAAALHVRLLTPQLEPTQLPNSLHIVADIEQDVGEELAVRFPPLVTKAEYQTYQSGVTKLLASLAHGANYDTLFNDQAALNSAVRDLAEVVFPLPNADAGEEKTVETLDPYARVTLDASRSQAAAGQRIVRYIWEEIEA